MVTRGLELAHTAHHHATVSGLSFLRVWPQSVIARLHLLNGDLIAAEAALKVGYAELRPEGLRWFSSVFLPLGEAGLALSRKEYADALVVCDNLIEFLQETRARPFLSDALYLRGKALMGMGRVDEARGSLLRARTDAESLGSRRSLWPILIALAEIERQIRNGTGVNILIQQAQEIVTYIADHLSNQELRAAFLALPEVQAIQPTQ
jgi:hypothetical protein